MNKKINVPILSDVILQGKKPEILFWVGCAGSFDERAKKITRAFVRILNQINIHMQFWVLKRVVRVIQQKELEMNFYSKCRQFLILKP